MALDFYNQFHQILHNGAAVLATVIHIKGSVPREVGAKLVIQASGDVFGTIGGGAGEAHVIQQGMQVLKTGHKHVVEIDLSGAPAQETDGICGGRMQVWLERWHGDSAIALVQTILNHLQAGQSVSLITPFSADAVPYVRPSQTSAPEHTFVELLQPPPTLLIVGAGHCGIQLAKMAHFIGFQIMVQDDRPEWANPSHYPQATMICTDAIATVIAQLAQRTQLYAALVTRGYSYDVAALTALLNRDLSCPYIGMIGSQRRVRQVCTAIIATGISKASLRSLYAPIGLDIGALTPEEIAVSICAELILVRRGGTGRPLCEQLSSFLMD
jgi:xanthine dehydrogenase accessory factor